MSLPICRVPDCGAVLHILLETGSHPVSNGYIREGEVAKLKPLVLAHCPSCELLQLAGTFSEVELAASVPSWVRYNEPEAHLDELAVIIADLMQGDTNRSVAGLTYIDQTLQNRLKKAGWDSQYGLDVLNGADAIERCSIEQMLAGVQSGCWGRCAQKMDLLLARHVFDHSRDITAFLHFIRSNLSSRGLVVFEVPNSIPDIAACNPLMLWESHANYFSPATFLRTLEAAGFKVEHFQEFVLPGPSALVAICSLSGQQFAAASGKAEVNHDTLQCYTKHFPNHRDALRIKLSKLRPSFSVVALLGAGHIGNLFLNLYGLGMFVDFAVDDDPRKSDLRLPGSGISIQPGGSLDGITDMLILMAVNPSSEDKAITRLRALHPTARFGSIFSGSTHSLLRI